MSILNKILALLFPPCCSICHRPTRDRHEIICPSCQLELPLTYDWLYEENELTERVRMIDPRIKHASAMMRYTKSIMWREVVFDFKYRRMRAHAELLGHLLGSYLVRSELYKDIDLVLPVPLHFRRKIARGYNQAEYIARGVAAELHAPVITNGVRRKRNNRSQASSPRESRWSNTEGIFEVSDAAALEGKHLLLVDDIFTTGSTILSLADELFRNVEGVQISIVTLGVVGRYHDRHLQIDPL